MIGVIKNDRIFEFKTMEELAYAIDAFGKSYNVETDKCVITNSSYKLIGFLEAGKYTVLPIIVEDTKYWLYYLAKNENIVIDKGSDVDLDGRGQRYPFFCVDYKVPKQLNVI